MRKTLQDIYGHDPVFEPPAAVLDELAGVLHPFLSGTSKDGARLRRAVVRASINGLQSKLYPLFLRKTREVFSAITACTLAQSALPQVMYALVCNNFRALEFFLDIPEFMFRASALAAIVLSSGAYKHAAVEAIFRLVLEQLAVNQRIHWARAATTAIAGGASNAGRDAHSSESVHSLTTPLPSRMVEALIDGLATAAQDMLTDQLSSTNVMRLVVSAFLQRLSLPVGAPIPFVELQKLLSVCLSFEVRVFGGQRNYEYVTPDLFQSQFSAILADESLLATTLDASLEELFSVMAIYLILEDGMMLFAKALCRMILNTARKYESRDSLSDNAHRLVAQYMAASMEHLGDSGLGSVLLGAVTVELHLPEVAKNLDQCRRRFDETFGRFDFLPDTRQIDSILGFVLSSLAPDDRGVKDSNGSDSSAHNVYARTCEGYTLALNGLLGSIYDLLLALLQGGTSAANLSFEDALASHKDISISIEHLFKFQRVVLHAVHASFSATTIQALYTHYCARLETMNELVCEWQFSQCAKAPGVEDVSHSITRSLVGYIMSVEADIWTITSKFCKADPLIGELIAKVLQMHTASARLTLADETSVLPHSKFVGSCAFLLVSSDVDSAIEDKDILLGRTDVAQYREQMWLNVSSCFADLQDTSTDNLVITVFKPVLLPLHMLAQTRLPGKIFQMSLFHGYIYFDYSLHEDELTIRSQPLVAIVIHILLSQDVATSVISLCSLTDTCEQQLDSYVCSEDKSQFRVLLVRVIIALASEFGLLLLHKGSSVGSDIVYTPTASAIDLLCECIKCNTAALPSSVLTPCLITLSTCDDLLASSIGVSLNSDFGTIYSQTQKQYAGESSSSGWFFDLNMTDYMITDAGQRSP